MHFTSIAALFTFFIGGVVSDTPANCSYEDLRGVWYIYESERNNDKKINCSGFPNFSYGSVVNTLQVELLFPNIVVDQYGHKGYWTVVYNQGVEIVLNYRKYFAFSAYKQEGNNVTSLCDHTLPGWSHDVLGHNWACYVGRKAESVDPKFHFAADLIEENYIYQINKNFIEQINSVQSSWEACIYADYEGMPAVNLLRRRGGPKSKIIQHPPLAPVTYKTKKLAENLPDKFDWRDVNGMDFVSPVQNQASCGSCYAFSSVGMMEARLRVASNNTMKIRLSPQDIVSCSEYSQGCEGGFPYLIAGKYTQDFGMTLEACYPYIGKDSPCVKKKCSRTYAFDYHYVGGFYGACNEEIMKIQLVKNGPLSVSFEVYSDFQHYKGGIYHHTGLKDGFNPFAITNHAVLLVGYGVEDTTGEKYWIVKNSWGTEWGENGYFRIRRGTNECNIETIAVEAIPIP